MPIGPCNLKVQRIYLPILTKNDVPIMKTTSAFITSIILLNTHKTCNDDEHIDCCRTMQNLNKKMWERGKYPGFIHSHQKRRDHLGT